MIDYTQPALGYLLRIPCSDVAADSPLDEPARARAEMAAEFLSFERIGPIAAADHPAARETAECVRAACSPGSMEEAILYATEDLQAVCSWLVDPLRGLPCVVVATGCGIETMLGSLLQTFAEAPSPQGEKEVVGPGGLISLHRDPETSAIVVRARTMVLNFAFADFVEAVNASGM